jgi:hypothetical protein
VVFKLSPGGVETMLHAFTSFDGAFPEAGLIADSSGNLYGTTRAGGEACIVVNRFRFPCGTVFKLLPTGAWDGVLYNFNLGTDGANPVADLYADSKGNLFGTTVNGGVASTTAIPHLGAPIPPGDAG